MAACKFYFYHHILSNLPKVEATGLEVGEYMAKRGRSEL